MNIDRFFRPRRLSVAAFSFSFVYLLSFLFEGQVLYSLLGRYGMNTEPYILTAMIAHFMGLFTCGLFVRDRTAAKYVMLGGMGFCLLSTIPFFFPLPVLWMGGLMISGYVSGCAVAAWGHFLKAFTPGNERIQSCAEVLICSNLLMIAVNVSARSLSPFFGLSLSMLCLVLGMVFIWMLPTKPGHAPHAVQGSPAGGGMKNPLLLLCLFIFIITINSGLMYQVINPTFQHLTRLTSWYWAVPYITALAILRGLPVRVNRSRFLYLGMAMMMGAFIGFMLLGRSAADYLIVDTLMLGACGVFDLFWWSILGEMLDYTDRPARVFGIGLSANVLGVLCGDVLGMTMTSMGLPGAEVAVLALTVVCVTLVLLPPLNRQLLLLLKNHAYLAAYDNMSRSQQTDLVLQIKTLDPLTVREQEVLQLILSGKSNREISEALFISENTVKTHARNIFSKYDVGSRAELISTLLKNQAATNVIK